MVWKSLFDPDNLEKPYLMKSDENVKTPGRLSFMQYVPGGFEVCDVSLGAAKEVRITERYSLPLFAKATWNPATEGAYFVFGVSF